MRTGQLVLTNESSIDFEVLGRPGFLRHYSENVKHLQISGTPVTSLEGLPPLNNLQSFVADRTLIDSFTNLSAISHATKISLKGTPLSRRSNYKLSLLLVFGPNLSSIDGAVISAAVRERAATYPSYAGTFVCKGWRVEVPCPDDSTWESLSRQWNIPLPSEPVDEDVEPSGMEDAEIEDFDAIVQEIRKQQEEMFARAEDQLEIPKTQIDDEVQLAEGIGAMLRAIGIPVDQNNDDDLVDEVRKLCRKAKQRQDALGKPEEEDF